MNQSIAAVGAGPGPKAPPRPRRSFAARFVRTPVAGTGAIIVGVYLLAAATAPALAPHDPLSMASQSLLAPPGGAYPFGTDQFGRDLLSRLLYGTRVSLTVSVASCALALAIGAAAGVASGHYGGRIDGVLMRAMDVIFAFPAVLLAIAIMAAAGTAV